MENSIYRNAEKYYDPTAGAAIAKCDKKIKSDRRKAVRKANAKARKQAAESCHMDRRNVVGHLNGDGDESV